MNSIEELAVLGGGLVGSLLALNLAKKNLNVSVYEKRPDPRKTDLSAGRSINLALSHRGLHALEKVELREEALKMAIPMKGRMMHDRKGQLTFQAYGKEGQQINSISRGGLNEMLIEHGEKSGVHYEFETKCEQIEFEPLKITLDNSGKLKEIEPKVALGADGAFSAMRQEMQKLDRFNFSQQYLEHGYKELSLPPKNGDFALEPNALHIWPRGGFMLIALPNVDKTFTCTLFFPFEGEKSFASIKSDQDILKLFEEEFSDVLELMPDLLAEFHENPTSSLVSISCFPWSKGNACLIGDAAHAIVPFYGQGMNAGFEDCRLFMERCEQMDYDWNEVLKEFEIKRKPDADAIRDLAIKNFIEMRDKVADEVFLERKSIEAKLNELFPKKWIPQYSMVTFRDIPYNEALRDGEVKDAIMLDLMNELRGNPEKEINYAGLLEKYDSAMKLLDK